MSKKIEFASQEKVNELKMIIDIFLEKCLNIEMDELFYSDESMVRDFRTKAERYIHKNGDVFFKEFHVFEAPQEKRDDPQFFLSLSNKERRKYMVKKTMEIKKEDISWDSDILRKIKTHFGVDLVPDDLYGSLLNLADTIDSKLTIEDRVKLYSTYMS